MSTFPQPPNEQQPRGPRLVPPRQKPKRRWTAKRVAAWIGVGVLILILVIVVAITLVLHTRSLRQSALHFAEGKISAALGTQVQVRDFALSLSRMTLDVYGVTVAGAQPYPTPPLLTVDHAGLGLGITSLLHRDWYVRSIQVDHPVAHVFVDPHGTDNLPQTKTSNGKSNTNLFQLGVRHAVLDRGEIYYNNRKSVLDADLHDLRFQSRFDPAQQRYSGGMSYRNGHLEIENLRPMAHDFDAEFDATPDVFTLRRAVLRSGPSYFDLKATVENYSQQPRISAQYIAVVDSGQFRQIMKNPSLPTGTLRANGTLRYQSEANVPMLAGVILNGDLSSQLLRVQMSSFRGDIRDLGARYSLVNGNAEVRDMRAKLLGGELTGTLVMRDITGASRSHLQAALRGISVAQLRPMLNSSALQQVSLAGTVNADADATWGQTMNDLAARSNATIQARVAPAQAGNAQSIPVSSIIHAQYLAARKQIAFSQSYLRTPQTSLFLNGTVSNRSSLQIRLQSNDLHELEVVAETFRRPNSGPAQQLGLYGTASFVGSVRGSTSAPELTGQLQAANVRAKGSSWRLLRTNVDLSPSVASLQNGELQPVDRGRITFNVRAGLRSWSFSENSPIQLGLNVSQVNVADLTKAAGSQAPVSGTLSAKMSVQGSEKNPIGQGSVSLTRAKISNEPLQAVNLKFQGTGNEVHANVTVQAPAGGAQAVLTYLPKQEQYQAHLQALGIRLDQLQTVKARNLQIAGVLNVRASGQGSIKNPELTASVDAPRLQVRNQTLGNLSLQTKLLNHVANIALDTQAAHTVVQARAKVSTTGDYYTDATINTQPIPLEPLVAVYAPSQAGNISGQTELHATLRGPLKNKAALDAHATIPTLQVNYKNTVQIGAPSPIHIDFSNGVLAVQRATIRGTDTDVQLQATVPTNSAAPASFLALGTLNLQIAQLFSPDITSSGQVLFDINSYGARSNPNVQGQIRIVNAGFATAEAPIGLQNGNGVLTLTKDRLEITQFTGMVGGGSVKASGGVVYRPGMQFDLALAGKGIRLLYPEGVRQGLDMNLTLTGSTDAAMLGGQIRIDQLSFTPDFDVTSLMGEFGGAATPPPTEGFSQNLQLNLAVQSTSGINLVSRTLSLQGNANLQIRGTAADPVVLGRLNLTGGDLIMMGNRYVLQGGTLDFANPMKTEPVVNVAANTTIQQYNIYLQFNGPADHLRTNYTSVPSLPPSDIINLLAFGKTSEAAAANPAPGNLGAESVLASQVSSQVTSRVEKIAGISRLSIDPVLGGNGSQQNPGARITVQQRVTGNIFVTFATDVTQTQNQVIELQYNASPRVTYSGTRDQNGGFGFDTRIRKSW
ncbi:MAG TPA: translocation/assembly module TamB domain-containing protein [Terriglobales bacterium]|nr:translocation/assembly module TamB domain-containing protein [Terriglobales bacterium]